MNGAGKKISKRGSYVNAGSYQDRTGTDINYWIHLKLSLCWNKDPELNEVSACSRGARMLIVSDRCQDGSGVDAGSDEVGPHEKLRAQAVNRIGGVHIRPMHLRNVKANVHH
ncbi:Hypothetical protein NTJ_05340 [Nesidiocoris tenuis]|uniref:Uncharacterized protein n=1 Tax=Nesidiocoris tenuis TaxID=355587 RepID=A0ABN7AJV1_9HEMI|nr:Hypothetical protein NTJ_05340 [Nesidiocoris tenuis]